MNISEILVFLEEEGMSEVEEITATDEFSIVKFIYDFDKDEIEAAKSYANEECDDDPQSVEWYRAWYNPYLLDISNDNVEGTIEDIMEEFGVLVQLKVLGADIGDSNLAKYMIAISENEELDLEDIINEYSE